MKFYTSYFYQLRFFTPNMIPISTAKFDPKWYNNFQGQGTVFVDKNGVYNGLRADPFVLPDSYWQDLESSHQECSKDCPHDQSNCAFMQSYYNYLCTLNFDDIVSRCERLASKVKAASGFTEEPIIVLLVHEPATCPCAERPMIHRWFHEHGIPISEWQKL